jgi:phosphoribosylformylglycinamidine cyclo-ligase
MPTDPNAPIPLSYGSTGVDYHVIDPFKVAAQRRRPRPGHPRRPRLLRGRIVARRIGLRADVGPFYLASIVECLGSKAMVADAMQALTGRSHLRGDRPGHDRDGGQRPDHGRRDPLVVQAYWAAGGSDWFADSVRGARL